MKKIDLSTASKPLSDYAEEFADDIIVLTSGDEPVAAVISLKNVDSESWALSTNEEFLKIIEHSRAEARAGKTLSLAEMKRAVLP